MTNLKFFKPVRGPFASEFQIAAGSSETRAKICTIATSIRRGSLAASLAGWQCSATEVAHPILQGLHDQRGDVRAATVDLAVLRRLAAITEGRTLVPLPLGNDVADL